MLFNSLIFAIFLPCAVAIYWLLPRHFADAQEMV